MENNYICDSKKYKFAHHTIALPITIGDLPDNIQIEGESLKLKSSFHVSLVCIGKIIEKYKITIDNFEDSVIADFCEFTKDTTVDIVAYDNFRFASDKERRTLIVMCKISNLDSFFDSINKKYNLAIENPPTHITLYTLQEDKGIFLVDDQDITEKTKQVSVPENISGLIK